MGGETRGHPADPAGPAVAVGASRLPHGGTGSTGSTVGAGSTVSAVGG